MCPWQYCSSKMQYLLLCLRLWFWMQLFYCPAGKLPTKKGCEYARELQLLVTGESKLVTWATFLEEAKVGTAWPHFSGQPAVLGPLQCTEVAMQNGRWHFEDLLQQPAPLHHAGRGCGQAQLLSRKLLGVCFDRQGTERQIPASVTSFSKLMLCFTFSWKTTFQNAQISGLFNNFHFYFLFKFFHFHIHVFLRTTLCSEGMGGTQGSHCTSARQRICFFLWQNDPV